VPARKGRQMETQPMSVGSSSRSENGRRKIILLVVVCRPGIRGHAWVVAHYLFRRPSHRAAEQRRAAAQRELERIDATHSAAGGAGAPALRAPGGGAERLEPERYTEAGAKREITSERELKCAAPKNTDLAQKLAIDLRRGMAAPSC